MGLHKELEKYDIWRNEVAEQTLDFSPGKYLEERDKMRAVELIRQLQKEGIDHEGVRGFTFETEVGRDPSAWV